MNTSASLPRPALRVERTDPSYLEQARAESEFWSGTYGFGIDAASLEHRNDPLKMYTNRRFTGDPHKRWVEEIPEYGTFRSGLTLGASGITQDAQILSQNPSLSMTICDISAPALASWERELPNRFPGRVAFRVAD